MRKILTIDDDLDLSTLLKSFLEKNNYAVETAQNGGDGLRKLTEKIDLILCDVKLPDIDGISLLKKIKSKYPGIAVIMITGYSDVKSAVDCLRLGAADYITKPLQPDELLLQINDLTEERAEKDKSPKSKKNELQKAQYIEGSSEAIQTVNKNISLVAPTDMSVIINGETGTGKEFAAKRIHKLSPRSAKQFIALDCGALPQELAGSELFGHVKGAFTGALANKTGHFELAHGGTLFLDEIGNLSYDNQVKLLRVLQERKVKKLGATKEKSVDIRLLVATNENLKDKVQNGEFREDLYHRLNEFSISLPPLSERADDIKIFSNHFIDIANKRLSKNIAGIDEKVLKSFTKYSWPGNLRELNNVIKRATLVSTGNKIKKESIPDEIIFGKQYRNTKNELNSSGDFVTGKTLKEVSEQAEKKAILQCLRENKFNKTRVAEILDIDRKTLYNKINAYGIEL